MDNINIKLKELENKKNEFKELKDINNELKEKIIKKQIINEHLKSANDIIKKIKEKNLQLKQKLHQKLDIQNEFEKKIKEFVLKYIESIKNKGNKKLESKIDDIKEKVNKMEKNYEETIKKFNINFESHNFIDFGKKCEHCKKSIERILYQCSQCKDHDFYLCDTCEKLNFIEKKHPHNFIKIRKPFKKCSIEKEV